MPSGLPGVAPSSGARTKEATATTSGLPAAWLVYADDTYVRPVEVTPWYQSR